MENILHHAEMAHVSAATTFADVITTEEINVLQCSRNFWLDRAWCEYHSARDPGAYIRFHMIHILDCADRILASGMASREYIQHVYDDVGMALTLLREIESDRDTGDRCTQSIYQSPPRRL